MYYNNTIKQERSTAKTYEHTLIDVKSVVDRHRCHIAAMCLVCLLMVIIASFLRYTGYINFIHVKDSITYVLLLVLVRVQLLSCPYF